MHGESKERIITDFELWKKEYKKDKSKVWIIVTLSNDVTYYLESYNLWYSIIEISKANNLKVLNIGLRYRSNVYRQYIKDYCLGVYLIRSATGSPGSETINTMTIGMILEEHVLKSIIQIPSLILTDSYEDNIENCSKEVILEW